MLMVGGGGWGWHTYDDETREIKDITADRETECTWHWLSGWLQEHTMCVYRLRCIFLNQPIESVAILFDLFYA